MEFWGKCVSAREILLLALVHFVSESHVLSYIGSATARHSSRRRQPNFAAWYLHATEAAIPFDIRRSNCLVVLFFSGAPCRRRISYPVFTDDS